MECLAVVFGWRQSVFAERVSLWRSLTSMFILIHYLVSEPCFLLTAWLWIPLVGACTSVICSPKYSTWKLLTMNNFANIKWGRRDTNQSAEPSHISYDKSSTVVSFCLARLTLAPTTSAENETKEESLRRAHLFRFSAQDRRGKSKSTNKSKDCQWSLLIKHRQKEPLGCCGAAIICDLWCC